MRFASSEISLHQTQKLNKRQSDDEATNNIDKLVRRVRKKRDGKEGDRRNNVSSPIHSFFDKSDPREREEQSGLHRGTCGEDGSNSLPSFMNTRMKWMESNGRTEGKGWLQFVSMTFIDVDVDKSCYLHLGAECTFFSISEENEGNNSS